MRIITFDGLDVGWIQISDFNRESAKDALFVTQIHLEAAYRRRGIDTNVMKRMIGEAARVNRAVAAGVAKINIPSLRMFERLGFCITREDDHRYYMRLEPADGRLSGSTDRAPRRG